jgi:tetratricopeptide (TPR) repeat protein
MERAATGTFYQRVARPWLGTRPWLRFTSIGVGLGLVGLVVAIAIRGNARETARDENAVRKALATAKYAQALEPLERWLRRSPNSAEAHLLKARVMLGLERPAEFETNLAKARELGASPDEVDVVRAILKAHLGRYSEAYPVLVRAFDENRGPDPQLDEALARVYLETYRLTLATKVLDRWTRDVPADPKPHLWRAEVDSRVDGGMEVVIEDYRRALQRDPKLAKARIGLAEALRNMHRNAQAAAEYEAYLILKPDDPTGHMGAGRNAMEQGDEATAIRHFDRAIAVDPKKAEAYLERAEIDMRRGDAAATLARLDQACKLDPFDFTIRYKRSLALAQLGRDDEAKAERETMKRLQAEDRQLKEIQAKLVQAPNDLSLQLKVTSWLFEHGHGSEGARWAEKILKERPGQPDACRLLANYHEREGNAGLANFYRLQTPSAGNLSPASR